MASIVTQSPTNAPELVMLEQHEPCNSTDRSALTIVVVVKLTGILELVGLRVAIVVDLSIFEFLLTHTLLSCPTQFLSC
jgi:hypothetical protein